MPNVVKRGSEERGIAVIRYKEIQKLETVPIRLICHLSIVRAGIRFCLNACDGSRGSCVRDFPSLLRRRQGEGFNKSRIRAIHKGCIKFFDQIYTHTY